MRKPITAANLPFRRFTFADSGRSIEFTEGSGRPGPAADDSALVRWRCTLTDYACDTARGRPDSTARERTRERRVFGGGLFGAPRPAVNRAQRSPDGKWEASIRNYNVYVRPTGGGEGVLLSTDGSEGDSYDSESITWSPDSRHLAAYRVRPGYQREVHYVASSPDDALSVRLRALSAVGSAEVPRPSRDASRLVFVTSLFGSRQAAVMPIDGPEARASWISAPAAAASL